MTVYLETGSAVVATDNVLPIFRRRCYARKGQVYTVADIGRFGDEPVVFLEGFPPQCYYFLEFFRPLPA